MRWSRFVIPTLREAPKDAEAVSHKLMIRAGLVRQLSSGVYSYLPLGWRVLKRVTDLIRGEMERAGAVELFLPGLHPAEIWKRTGRFESLGEDKFSFRNRAGHEYVLGPTHEEVVTLLMGESIGSYRQLPVTVFQIQTKFRDEARPRFGVIRSKEFIMKDAYSFDVDQAGLDKSYEAMYEAYRRIFTRAGLEFEIVQADPGLMGGNFSHEFMLPSDFGEDITARCSRCNYLASREIAAISPPTGTEKNPSSSNVPKPEVFDTPGLKTIEEITRAFNLKKNMLVKSLVYMADEKPAMVLVRGDHEANDAKMRRAAGAKNLRMATAKEIETHAGAPVGFVGPVSAKKIPLYADFAVMQMADAVTGANQPDRHMKHVVPPRDFTPTHVGDLRYAEDGDVCGNCGEGKLGLKRAMEIGHVFKLGTRYSAPLDAKFLNAEGKKEPFIMGCYGIGVNRIMAGAIEQHHDERGIIWPPSIAPFLVEIITVNEAHEDSRRLAERMYENFLKQGIDVLYDDRNERAGVKFNDADLVGIPFQVIVGEKNLAAGKIEVKNRKTGERTLQNPDGIASFFQNFSVELQRAN